MRIKKEKQMVFLFLWLIVFLTGCNQRRIADEIQNEILKSLTYKGIIDSNWKYLSKSTVHSNPFGDLFSYKYFYETDNSQYITINLEKYISEINLNRENVILKANTVYYEVTVMECSTYGYQNDDENYPYVENCNYDERKKYLLHYTTNDNKELILEREK